ncbi:two-component sensor histidine kinase [Sulfurimonas gotlandica GD1]|uniref:histidine kinase n=1 Tax=Sulfurimonas gotlandica (strain DSM 19862 / JCM 16533 / GD1) TaxID=929558 RepID=B6BKU6_SULGG|nr:HAMP domain-containing sensor histidine kinase [Sulfurimonas gotlandica]EDZ62235.1 histidine kinase [Sulfurimonas gotlandica GD1]EHP29157.1 two-component sensor histidine kinase [Sulfurimonas gotlandica GD1]
MLKIHQIFIIKFLLLFVGTLFITSLISYVALKSIIIEHSENHLENAIVMMGLDLEKIDDLDAYSLIVNKHTNLRVTMIDADGVVIAESSADKSTMDNHASRYEIMQANKDEFSHITRYSKTLKVDFLYVAKKFSYRDKNIYIRLSMSLAQVMSDFYSLWSKLFLVFLTVVLIAFYISKRMSARIIYDIEQITIFLDEISNKNYNAIIKTKYFYEFLQISLMLKNLVKKLSTRDKQKRKYTAKLRLMNKQRNDILSAISHEFKNPVASIIGYTQTLQEDPDINPKIREKFLSKISSNGDKISQMLDRLALSVKLENDDLKMEIKRFDMKTLCEEVVSNLSLKYRDREITLEATKTMIEADKTMIELALINLVDNALKYSEVEVNVVLKDNELSVIDKGIGIQEENIDKVTAKFYRVKKNTWDNSMGIGLAMVSYILKMHNSKLQIKSQFAEGSVFSFSLKEMLIK